MKSDLAELLQDFRLTERPESVACALGDRSAVKVVAAWPNVGVTWRSPRTKPPSEPVELWRWIWEGASFSNDTLASLTGLTRREAHRAFVMVWLNRLVYPDGTVSQFAQSFVAHQLRQAMGIAHRRPQHDRGQGGQ